MNTDIFKTGKAVIKFCGDFKIVLIFDGSNQTFYNPFFIVNYNCLIHINILL